MTIQNSILTDIDEIFRLYGVASDYQRSKQHVVVWPKFEREMVVTEITENRQWKLLIDGQIACVWVTTFSDEQIWEERNADPAVYIHRIATNPDFRGQNWVEHIVNWAKKFARKNNKEYVRLDTIGENLKLIEHYTKNGFEFLGMFGMKNTDGLPEHYENGKAALFEIKVDSR